MNEYDNEDRRMVKEETFDDQLGEFNTYQFPILDRKRTENSIIPCSNMDTKIEPCCPKSEYDKKATAKPKRLENRKKPISKDMKKNIFANEDILPDSLEFRMECMKTKLELERLKTEKLKAKLAVLEGKLKDTKSVIKMGMMKNGKEIEREINEFMNSDMMLSFWNPKQHKRALTFPEYETYLSTMHFPLEYAADAADGKNFISLSNGGETMSILKLFYPQYYIDDEIILNEQLKPMYSVLTFENKFTGDTFRSTDAKFENKNNIGGLRGEITTTRKHTRAFPILSSINFDTSKTDQAEKVNHMIDVINEYKKHFMFANAIYQIRFHHAIDEIVFYYLNVDAVPEKEQFTVERLLDNFNPDELMNNVELFYTEDEIIRDENLMKYNSLTCGRIALNAQMMANANGMAKDPQDTGDVHPVDIHLLGLSPIPRDYVTLREWFRNEINRLSKEEKMPTIYMAKKGGSNGSGGFGF